MNEKDTNPVRKLRNAMQMTQNQFANKLGLSLASIQNYERGSQPSAETIYKMQGMAADHGLDAIDLAFKLVPHAHGVARVFTPADVGKPIRLPNTRGTDLTDSMHDSVDFLLNNGDAETIAAVDTLLQLVRRSLGGKV